MRSMMWRNGLVAVVAVAAVGLNGCSGEQQSSPPPPTVQEQQPSTTTTPQEPAAPAGELPEGVTQEMVNQGQQVFTGTTCFTCHGPDGSGTTLAPNLRSGPWLNIERGDLAEIEAIIRSGVASPVQFPAPMPPMGGANLTDDQVRNVAAYVYSISRGKS